MSEQQALLVEAAESIFESVGEANFAEAWTAVEDAGFGILLVEEASGGFGGDWADFYAVMREAGKRALPLPLGEMVLGTWCAHRTGLEAPPGMASIAVEVQGEVRDGHFSGVLQRIPWGRRVDAVVAVASGRAWVLPTHGARIEARTNPAGEPRDDLHYTKAEAAPAAVDVDLRLCAALMRVGQMSGAADSALAMSVEHANSRKQFGRVLAKFQAVQQNLAVLAAETAAVNSAGQAAALARDRDPAGDGAELEIAAAKLRANMAVGTVTSIAHQVHGAIGFTEEYPLHRLTRRMMGWRSEYGNDRYWAEQLGARAARLGGAGLWREITRRSDFCHGLPGQPA